MDRWCVPAELPPLLLSLRCRGGQAHRAHRLRPVGEVRWRPSAVQLGRSPLRRRAAGTGRVSRLLFGRCLPYAAGGGRPRSSGTTGSAARNIAAISGGRSRPRWRAVRTTLARTCWVSAPWRVRLPPHTLRMTTAGRMAGLSHATRGPRGVRATPSRVAQTCVQETGCGTNGDGVSDFAVAPVRGGQGPLPQNHPLIWLNDGSGRFAALKVQDFVPPEDEWRIAGSQLMRTRHGYSFITPQSYPGSGGLIVTGLLATRSYP